MYISHDIFASVDHVRLSGTIIAHIVIRSNNVAQWHLQRHTVVLAGTIPPTGLLQAAI